MDEKKKSHLERRVEALSKYEPLELTEEQKRREEILNRRFPNRQSLEEHWKEFTRFSKTGVDRKVMIAQAERDRRDRDKEFSKEVD